jgi:hypothetical protein
MPSTDVVIKSAGNIEDGINAATRTVSAPSATVGGLERCDQTTGGDFLVSLGAADVVVARELFIVRGVEVSF